MEDQPNIYANLDGLRRLQYEARGFSFKATQPINSILSGINSSKLRGRGLNFEELRQYRPGDDIRSMDWKVTRRTGKPHIKVYTEEKERNVYISVDQRSSMFFGSTGKMKSVVAAELAALIAWRIVEVGDRIGGLTFNNDDCVTVPAKRGRQHVVQLLHTILKQNHQLKSGVPDTQPSSSINRMLTKLNNICAHDNLILLIGDGAGWNDDSTDLVKKLRQHNEVIACHVFDPLEKNLPRMSQMVISDGQSQIQLSSKNQNMQKQYKASLERELALFDTTAKCHRIPLISINTLEPVVKQLRKSFGQVVL